jgi:pimeloyl-ACP methyl ester carboxylesterase
MTVRTLSVPFDGTTLVPITLDDQGEGRPVLLLHGGAGPTSVGAFGGLLASAAPLRVLTPTHPGFGGTDRPEALDSIRGLAQLYVAALELLDLEDVLVVGNSIGGWIAAEIATLASARVSAVALVDAVGLAVPEHPVADFFALSFDELAQLSYADPARFRIDPSALPPAARATMAGNRAALATYAGTTMVDPGLAERLPAVALPTLVVWGDHDRVVEPEVGLAYAAAIPGARFVLLDGVGHLPQLERPEALLPVLLGFAADAED